MEEKIELLGGNLLHFRISYLQYSMVGVEYRAAQLTVFSVQVVMVLLAILILLLSGTM